MRVRFEGGGKFFTRPYIPRPPRASYIRWGKRGWFAPAKGAKYGVLWAPALCGSMSGKPVSAGDGVCTTNLINTTATKQRSRRISSPQVYKHLSRQHKVEICSNNSRVSRCTSDISCCATGCVFIDRRIVSRFVLLTLTSSREGNSRLLFMRVLVRRFRF